MPSEAGDPELDGGCLVEIAFAGLETGIANHAGGTTNQCDYLVAVIPKAAQHQQRHQMTDMQAAGGGIETTINDPAIEVQVVG